MIHVRSQVVMSREEMRMLSALTADGGFGLAGGMNAFLDEQALTLVASVQNNIAIMGQGGGARGETWQPLSSKYAARKAAHKTPGGAKFGAPAMLRDSGKSFDAIQAVVDRRTMSINLVVPQVLAYHFNGDGNNPQRSPVTPKAMAFYEQRFQQALEAFLGGQMNRASTARGAGSVSEVRAVG